VEQGSMVLLHGFIKKTQKTPQREIDLALKRKKRGGA
jgi:phage-related protein